MWNAKAVSYTHLDAGATEQLKASDPMRCVGLMNTCKAQAEEILMAELIHSLSLIHILTSRKVANDEALTL